MYCYHFSFPIYTGLAQIVVRLKPWKVIYGEFFRYIFDIRLYHVIYITPLLGTIDSRNNGRTFHQLCHQHTNHLKQLFDYVTDM